MGIGANAATVLLGVVLAWTLGRLIDLAAVV